MLFEHLTLTNLPPEDEALRAPVRAFLAQHMAGVPPDRRARSWSGFDSAFSRALGAQGWIGLTLPREHGGAGRSLYARFVMVEELLRAGAPVAAHWIADRQSAPHILKFGTPAQAAFYLPRICRGEIFFCIGMSEPGSGSDLASVRTRAIKTATGWRLSGQKIWTTNAHHSQYMIALVRTSGDEGSRQKGLSQVIVDLSLPGVTVRPITDLTGDAHFCEVFFDGVELAEDALIGNEGDGWLQVTSELAFERAGPERIYSSVVLLDAWLKHLYAQNQPSATSLALAGRLLATVTVLRGLSISVTGLLASGQSPVVEAALVKDLGTTLEQFVPEAIADAMGEDPDAKLPEDLLRTLTYVSQIAPTYSLRGGTREVLRGMIARSLGLR
ncbi:MAG: acyl-CoA dehydrogenase family protein [Pseudorhodobacter sp.]|nr:acyl-CoA dehydrogenase family protein [Rhizobacter sp.]